MKTQDFLKKYRISPKEFVQNTSVYGAIRSDNPLVPSGEQLSYTREDGTAINFVASDISQEDAQFKTPEYILNQVRQNGTLDQSKSTYLGIPELDQTYGRVYSEARDVYESDLIAQQLSSSGLTEKEYEDLTNRYTELTNNPEKDRFVAREADIISVETGENLTQTQGLTVDKLAKLKSNLTNGK